jgi:hypothetical protein
MSTSAILPISAPSPIDYNSASATSAEQAVFNSVLNQLQQSVSTGDLPSSQTLLNAVEAISPSASTGTTPLATFLSSLTSALGNNSVSSAQAALAAYQQAIAASTSTTPAVPAIPTANTAAEAAQIAASLVRSENQLLLADSLLNPNNSLGSLSGSSATSGSSSNISSLVGILNAAYPSSSSTGASTSSTSAAETTSATPYDTLVSSIQASLAAGNGTLTPALTYLQAAGNFVNTSA